MLLTHCRYLIDGDGVFSRWKRLRGKAKDSSTPERQCVNSTKNKVLRKIRAHLRLLSLRVTIAVIVAPSVFGAFFGTRLHESCHLCSTSCHGIVRSLFEPSVGHDDRANRPRVTIIAISRRSH